MIKIAIVDDEKYWREEIEKTLYKKLWYPSEKIIFGGIFFSFVNKKYLIY